MKIIKVKTTALSSKPTHYSELFKKKISIYHLIEQVAATNLLSYNQRSLLCPLLNKINLILPKTIKCSLKFIIRYGWT